MVLKRPQDFKNRKTLNKVKGDSLMGELLIVIGLGAGLVVGITVTVLKIKAMRKYLKKDKQDKI